MAQNNPLDAPETPRITRTFFDKAHRFFFLIEVSLWVLCLGFWFRGSLHWVLLPGLVLLVLYLLFPIVVFGSRGWRRHLFSHLAGIAISSTFIPVLFLLESWEGTQAFIQFSLSVNLVLAVAALWWHIHIRKNHPEDSCLLHTAGALFMAVLLSLMLAMY